MPRTTTDEQKPLAKPGRPTVRTALRDLERTQFDALELAQLRDLDLDR